MTRSISGKLTEVFKRQNILVILLTSLLFVALSWLFHLTYAPDSSTAKIAFTIIDNRQSRSDTAIEQRGRLHFLEALTLRFLGGHPYKCIDFNGSNKSCQFKLYGDGENFVVTIVTASANESNDQAIAFISSLQTMLVAHNQKNTLKDVLAKLKKNIQQLDDKNNGINITHQLNAFAPNILPMTNAGQTYLTRRLVDVVIEKKQMKSTLALLAKLQPKREDYLTIPAIAEHPDIERLVVSLNRLKQEIAHLQLRMNSAVQIKAMQAETNELNRQIDQKITEVIAQLHNRYSILDTISNELIAQLGYSSWQQVGHNSADRNITTQLAENLQGLVNELEGLSNMLDQDSMMLRISDVRPINTSDSNSILYFLVVSLLCGLIVASGILVIYRLSVDSREKKHLPPELNKSRDEGENNQPNQSVELTDLYASLSTANIKKLAIFGERAEHYAALIALNISDASKQILIIDCSGGEMRKYMGDRLGVTDIINGRTSVAEAIDKEQNNNIHVLSNGLSDLSPSDKNDEDLSCLLQKLSLDYSLIILAVSGKPIVSLHGFLDHATEIVVVKNLSKSTSGSLWMKTLNSAGFNSAKYLLVAN